MRFKLTVTFPDGKSGCEYHDVRTMQDLLARLSKFVDMLAVGETYTIERIS